MTFQVNVRIRRIGHIVEIEGLGTSVKFHPKDYDKTLNALIDRCIELQPDLASDSDEIDYIMRSIQIQLTEIYKIYEQETKNKEFDSKTSNANTKKTYYIHKYSKGIPLVEAVIVAGKPYFIQMKGRLDFDLLDKITIGNIEAKPKDTDSYLCEPYVFESARK